MATASPIPGFSGNMVACVGNSYDNPGSAANSTNPAMVNGIMFAQSMTRHAQRHRRLEPHGARPARSSFRQIRSTTTSEAVITIRRTGACCSQRCIRRIPACPIRSTGARPPRFRRRRAFRRKERSWATCTCRHRLSRWGGQLGICRWVGHHDQQRGLARHLCRDWLSQRSRSLRPQCILTQTRARHGSGGQRSRFFALPRSGDVGLRFHGRWLPTFGYYQISG